jgi:hypothetical protein
MAKAKKKMLPKDFEALLAAGNLDALKSVFDTHDVNARGGVFKQTALAFDRCPDELARWLHANGADLEAADNYGDTPLISRAGNWRASVDVLLDLGANVNAGENGRGTALHAAARSCNPGVAEKLIRHGANIEAVNTYGKTPLAYLLQNCSNANLERAVQVARILLDAGARRTPDMKAQVTRIGTVFEFHRANFNPELVDETSAALEEMYALFGVPPVPRRICHDGKSPIVARSERWEDRHQELWELLVPSSGAADTVQGEVVRITGRIANEIDGNGGVNWDAAFRKMADAFLVHVTSGVSLPAEILAEARDVVAEIRRREDGPRRLCELAVKWVELNPGPMKLPKPDYNR